MEQSGREPSKETIENTVAIARLASISERTTKDVDRLVKHIEEFIPVHKEISNLKKTMYASITFTIAFGSWMALDHFKDKSNLQTFIAVQEEQHKEAAKERNYNKNQITYLKGRIK